MFSVLPWIFLPEVLTHDLTKALLHEHGNVVLLGLLGDLIHPRLFRDDLSVNDITKAYALYERGMMYDWCISSGNYSLCQYSEKMLPLFIAGLTK